jgi:crotonobetainyl-CoA:carnitine CoA-transferase CaiB-like acyl-CoA transferase
MAMSGPLDGIKVFELTQIVAGPFCGVNLADLGADVIKVEPPEGEGGRVSAAFAPGESKFYHTLNRGKRSLVVDLTKDEGRALVHRIMPSFDVFVVNARPGVPERLGLGYEQLRQYRPDLVYFENTGFGRRGPSAQRSGSDIVAQAYSGLLAGDAKIDQFGAPEMISATAPADYGAGLAGAMGICAALFHRERTGEGQYLESSLLQVGLALQTHIVGQVPVYEAMVGDQVRERIRNVQASGGSYGDVLAARGDMFSVLGYRAGRLYYGGYAVQDGGIILGALTPANRDQMRRAIGVEDDPTGDEDFDGFDPANNAIIDELFERIRAIMLTRTMDEWMERFDAEGAPVSKVNIPDMMADDPQIEAMGYMLELEHETTGPERMVGPVVTMAATPTGSHLASPPLGRHTDEVLREAGIDDAEIARLRAAGAIA